jgi:hypothetical protein
MLHIFMYYDLFVNSQIYPRRYHIIASMLRTGLNIEFKNYIMFAFYTYNYINYFN